MADAKSGQQHPLGIYFWVWGGLFVFSVCSYLVDLSPLEGFSKWSLIVLFMLLKAALIVTVFMHMVWERRSIALPVLLPTGVLLFLMLLMAIEGEYISVSRMTFFGG
jgi:cytochrome c oxidase subunit IV